MCRGNNAQVDRRVEYIVWYRTYLRTDGKRDSRAATSYHCLWRILYRSEGALATRCGSLKMFLHYPRYPWEQKWSYGSYIAMISLLIHPFRAKCCTRCFTMPVFAKEQEYREYCSCIVFFLFFFPPPPFPQGGRLISSEHPERGKQEVKA